MGHRVRWRTRIAWTTCCHVEVKELRLEGLVRLVREIHNGIKGRVRYKVNGLYRSPVLKDRLERLAHESLEVNDVEASVLT